MKLFHRQTNGFPAMRPTDRETLAEDLLTRGRLLFANQRYSEAVGTLRRATEKAPKNPRMLMALARVYDDLCQDHEAEAVYRRLLSLEPNNAEVHRLLGRVYLRQDHCWRADREFRRALRLEPNAETYRDIGLLELRRNRLSKALSAFRSALTVQPHYGEVYFHLGTVYRHLGDVERAINNFSMAICLQPEDPSALTELFEIYLTIEQWDWALEVVCCLEKLSDPRADALGTALRLQTAMESTRDPSRVSEETRVRVADVVRVMRRDFIERASGWQTKVVQLPSSACMAMS